MGYELVTDHFPLVLSLLDGKPTLEESNKFREDMQKVLDDGKKLGQIVDLRYSVPEEPEQRKLFSKFNDKIKDQVKALSVGCVFVAPSVLMRTILNFVMFFSPLSCEYKIVRDIPEAVAWLEGQFRKAGLEFPESARPALKELAAKTGPQ